MVGILIQQGVQYDGGSDSLYHWHRPGYDTRVMAAGDVKLLLCVGRKADRTLRLGDRGGRFKGNSEQDRHPI